MEIKVTADDVRNSTEDLRAASQRPITMPDVVTVGTWPRPIPVTERLPEGISTVLVFATAAKTQHCWWSGWYDCHKNKWLISCVDIELENVTHWLPMPPAP